MTNLAKVCKKENVEIDYENEQYKEYNSEFVRNVGYSFAHDGTGVLIRKNTTLEFLLKSFDIGFLQKYENNRNISTERVRSWYRHFEPLGLDCIHVGYFQNETMFPHNAKSYLKMCDFHHRLALIDYIRESNTELWEKIKKNVITMIICHSSKHMETYRVINASKAHNHKDYLDNPDYAFSNLVNSIIVDSRFPRIYQEFGYKKQTKDSFRNLIARVLLHYNNYKPVADVWRPMPTFVTNKLSTISGVLTEEPDSLNKIKDMLGISTNELKTVVSMFTMIGNIFIKAYKDTTPDTRENLKPLIMRMPFIEMMVRDSMKSPRREREFMDQTVNQIANNIRIHLNDISYHSKMLDKAMENLNTHRSYQKVIKLLSKDIPEPSTKSSSLDDLLVDGEEKFE